MTPVDQCLRTLPGWAHLTPADLVVDAPRGFSSITATITAPSGTEPPAIFYRRLEGKENTILDPAGERAVFRVLAEQGIAAPLLHDEESFRLEGCYRGRTLTAADLSDQPTLAAIAAQIYRFHQISPPSAVPAQGFFELLHHKWGKLGRRVLDEPPPA